MTLATILAAVTIAFPKEGAVLPSLSRCYVIGATSGDETELTISTVSSVAAVSHVSVSQTGAWGALVDVAPGTNVVEVGDCRRTFVVEQPPNPPKPSNPPKPYLKLPYAQDKPAKHKSGRKPMEIAIAIDAGHGGADAGAVSPHGLPEKDANLRLAKAVAAKLEKRGYRVLMTRTGDGTLELYDRPKEAHAVKADVFVSIHHNAPGYEQDPTQCRHQSVYAWNAAGERLAKAIVARMEKARPDLPSKGALHANFAVTRSPEIPSCLVEADFITHPEGERATWDPVEREKCATAIADGIFDIIISQKGNN